MTLPYQRALVTGATGVVGRRLSQALREQGAEVTLFSLPGGDITDQEAVTKVMSMTKPEVIFHLAAYGTYGHEQDVQRMIEVNIGGTHNLLSAAAQLGCKAFVFAASAKEYATSRVPITEETPLRSWDEYAVTKAAAASFCRLFAERSGLAVTVLRLSPVYGPGDSPTRFILTAIRAALEEAPFTLSVGSLVRNFTYVDDVVEAFLLAPSRAGGGYEEFNINAPDAHSFEDVLTAVEQATRRKISRVIVPYAGGSDDSWVVDSSKAERLLGWRARVSLDEGIRRTVEWYRQENP